MAEYDSDSLLSRLRKDYHEGSKTLQSIGLKREQVVEEVVASSREMLRQAQTRTSQLEEELDEIKAAYVQSADLQNLQEAELMQIMTKFGGQDVALLHEDITALQKEVNEVEQQILHKQAALAQAETLANNTRKTVETDLVPLEKLQVQLQLKEEKLRAQIQVEGKQDDVLEYFSTQAQLLKKQQSLEEELHDKEQQLLALRQDICSLDVNGSNFNERERENAKLYVEWKQALQQKMERYVSFRQKQYELLMHINGRRETLHIITDLLTQFKVENQEKEEEEIRAHMRATEQRIQTLEDGLSKTQAAIDAFRVQFEQIRVAIMLDKAQKSTQVGQLRRERDHLKKADSYFQKLYDDEKAKIMAEVDKTWAERFAAIQKEGKAELRREKRALEEKMGMVKAALQKRFEAGLQPIMDKVKTAYDGELEQHQHLRKEIGEKEKLVETIIDDTHDLRRRIAGVEQLHVDEASAIRERDALLAQLQELWKETNTSAEDVAGFYSDLDLLAPFNDAVLEFYERREPQLTQHAAPSTP